MYQYLLFDLDGTLTNPEEGITKSAQYALKKMGIEENDLEKLKLFIGPPILDNFMNMYGMSETDGKRAIEIFRERFAPIGVFENKLYPGIKEMLAELKAAGKTLVVASSKAIKFVEQILEYFEIKEYFDIVMGSEMDGTRSKKEEVVEEVLRQLDLLDKSPEYRNDNAVMIGDRKFDVEGAKEYNLTSIGVTFGFAPEGELEKAGADYIVNTVEELKKFLLEDRLI